ncbi:MAG: hypothetical protein CBC35_00900 [Planctomycetes bacterium TMED75]|nr:hypothetical protein [Planctomycetaceae bacterium]OUU96564.1 MAG: hypothetical protein CBC35_00900 [Planctomycetes bacterium TMED75]
MRSILPRLAIPALLAFLLGGCTTVKEYSAPVELRPASNAAFKNWERTDFHVGGLDTWVAPNATIVSDEIVSASRETNAFGDHTITLEFSSKGAKKINALSNRRMSRPVAVLLDGRVIAAPVLMKPVANTLVINFGNTEKGAREARSLEQAVNKTMDEKTVASSQG